MSLGCPSKSYRTVFLDRPGRREAARGGNVCLVPLRYPGTSRGRCGPSEVRDLFGSSDLRQPHVRVISQRFKTKQKCQYPQGDKAAIVRCSSQRAGVWLWVQRGYRVRNPFYPQPPNGAVHGALYQPTHGSRRPENQKARLSRRRWRLVFASKPERREIVDLPLLASRSSSGNGARLLEQGKPRRSPR